MNLNKEFPTKENNFCGFKSFDKYLEAHWEALQEYSSPVKIGAFKLIITMGDSTSEDTVSSVFFLVRDILMEDGYISFMHLQIPFDKLKHPEFGSHIPLMHDHEDFLQFMDRMQKELDISYNSTTLYYPTQVSLSGRFEYYNGKLLDNEANRLTMNYKHNPPPVVEEVKDDNKPQVLPFTMKGKKDI